MSRPYILRRGISRLQDLADGMLAGLPVCGDTFWADPANGNDSNDGSAPDKAMTVKGAYDRCVDGHHDAVLMIGSATSYSPATAFTWSKNFTHLIGVTNPLPGMGQRCRITNTAALDLAILFTISGYGCLFENIQWFDGKDKNEAGACVLVSGNRNLFRNCFMAGMGHATPAAVAGSYSLKVSGAENAFQGCTVGLDTIVRAAANAEIIISGARNRFEHCDIRSYSVTAGKFLVALDNSGGDLRETIFDDCLFYNYTPNWASGITDAFNLPASGATYYVILRGNNTLVGVGTGWADVVTHLYSAQGAPNAGFGIAAAPTT